ncbi:MAG: TolC family protein [Kiritimatiellaeota bacterium]|nr:TolC family protein [Kiritimatiellota bacterium]
MRTTPCHWRSAGVAVFVAAAAALLLSGCTTSRRLAQLDRRCRMVLQAVQERTRATAGPERLDIDAYEAAQSGRYNGPLKLDLRRTLQLAARHSREYQTAKENLYESAISLYVAAHGFEWNTGNSFEATLKRDLSGPSTSLSGDGSLDLSRKFATGARLSVNLAITTLRYLTGDRSVNITSLAGLTLRQPLLSGRGRLVAREPLTQAERNVIYALRAYVRKRKQLSFDVASSYYQVLSAQDAVDVATRNYENLKASRERSELMAQAGRLPEFQVDQARQNELSAESALLTRRNALKARKDSLKQLLGLPLSVLIELDRRDLGRLAASKLPPPPEAFAAAVSEALDHRLDLATVRDELADAERAVKITRDAMRTKLDLVLGANASSPTRSQLTGIEWDQGAYSAGVSGSLPLDKTAETAAYRRALIRLEQRRRAVALTRDQIEAALRRDWRDLRTGSENYRIQKVSVDLARKRVESTELLFQAGRVNMRDVLEARDALTRTENNLTQALVSYRLDWLRLLIDMERLSVDPATLWAADFGVTPAQAAGPTGPAPKNGARK